MIRRHNAFTLAELLVSIALALILILGVNQIFKITSDTVGATNMLAEKTRDARAARQTFVNDFNGAIVSGAPFLIIQAEHTFAFRDRADLAGDRDGQPSTFDAAGTGAEGSISATDVSVRSHRIDQLRFFTSYLLRRQTGVDEYVADASMNEGVITYGHLNVFDGIRSGNVGTVSAADFRLPGPSGGNLQVNPNNFFASDWILGRNQLLLARDAVNQSATGHFSRTEPPAPSASELGGQQPPTFPITPVSQFSASPSPTFYIQSSRYDLAEGSMADIWAAVSRYTDYNAIRQNQSAAAEANWWDPPQPPPGMTDRMPLVYRFWANPYPSRPVDSLQAALTSPIFLRGCTQFIVEFAGDFGDQSAGQLLPAPGHDGVVDYIQDNNGTRRIRWYGFPRDVGSPTNNTAFKGGPDGKIEAAWDVVPLRDVFNYSSPPPNWPEKVLPTSNIQGDYAGRVTGGAKYLVAFGPRELEKDSSFKPKLIRITLVLDDPTNKLSDGQTYEYIFKLGL